MSFDGFIGLRNKDELKEDYYKFHVESLKKYSPLRERDLFPYESDGVEAFKYDLSICLIHDIKIKGIRNIKKNHSEVIIDDEDLIKEELYKFYTNKVNNLYGEIDDSDWGVDGDWFNIINNICWERYDFRFIDYDILKIQVNNALMNSSNIDNMCYWLVKKVNANKKYDSWQKVLEFR